jgi:outer membrane protein assembly factor BamB
VVGACDGFLYALDAESGRVLGSRQMAPEHRWVNILGQLMSAWPLGGGLVIDKDGIAYTAAGSTATDGAIVAAVNIVDGSYRWRENYTLDRKSAALSFGVQSNVLLHGNKLLVNGGAPIGIVAVDAASGQNAEVVAKLDVGREMFVEPDGTPFCAGPELYSDQWARTTIFKRHQGRAYFQLGSRHLALVAGRLFCAAELTTLDAIVQKMNSDPTAGGNRVVSEPWDVMQVPLPGGVLWSSATDDIRGLAVGTDGVIVLREDRVEALSVNGESLWSVQLKAPPVRWGIALAGDRCIVTLTDGQVVAVGADK